MKYAYVGCRTTRERNARGKGLKVYEISEVTGDWKEIQCLETEPNPSYQTLDLEEKYLYSVHGDITKVSSYRILDDGRLEHMNTIDIGGKNPVFITPDKTNKYIVVAALQGRSCLCDQKKQRRNVRRDRTYHTSGRQKGRHDLLRTSVYLGSEKRIPVCCDSGKITGLWTGQSVPF